jgi:hypothetical protein
MRHPLQHELSQQKLSEILDLAKEAEQQTKDLCEMITNHADKWKQRDESPNITGCR